MTLACRHGPGNSGRDGAKSPWQKSRVPSLALVVPLGSARTCSIARYDQLVVALQAMESVPFKDKTGNGDSQLICFLEAEGIRHPLADLAQAGSPATRAIEVRPRPLAAALVGNRHVGTASVTPPSSPSIRDRPDTRYSGVGRQVMKY